MAGNELTAVIRFAASVRGDFTASEVSSEARVMAIALCHRRPAQEEGWCDWSPGDRLHLMANGIMHNGRAILHSVDSAANAPPGEGGGGGAGAGSGAASFSLTKVGAHIAHRLVASG